MENLEESCKQKNYKDLESLRSLLIEEYEGKLEAIQQDMSKSCLNEKNDIEAFKDTACDT